MDLRFHAGRSRSSLMDLRFNVGRSRSLFTGLRFHAGRSRSLAMTFRFSALEARLHRGPSGLRERECREPAMPSGPPEISLGPAAIPLGAICDPLGPSAMPSALPAMPSASYNDPSHPLAVGLRRRLVDDRLKGEGSIGIAAPFVSPRLGKGPQRVAFVEPLRERTCHRGVKPSVAIHKRVTAHSAEGFEMGPRSFAGAFEGCGDGRYSPVGDWVDLARATQL